MMTLWNVHWKGAAEPQPALDLDQAKDSRASSKVQRRVRIDGQLPGTGDVRVIDAPPTA
jgi:hypothetical protein